MSDQSDPPTGTAETEGKKERSGPPPWTIKNIPEDVRYAASEAAKTAKMPIGEWLSRAIRDAIKNDRNAPRGLAVIPGAPEAVPRVDPEVDLASIERLTKLAAELAVATGEAPPKTVSRAAYSLIRERLAALKQPGAAPPPRGKKAAAAAAAEDEDA